MQPPPLVPVAASMSTLFIVVIQQTSLVLGLFGFEKRFAQGFAFQVATRVHLFFGFLVKLIVPPLGAFCVHHLMIPE
jgi:hypothetical protein